MKKYTSYKDSGVEWIGEIPEHWETPRITHLFPNIGSGTTPKASNNLYYNGFIPFLQTGDLNDGCIYTTTKTVTQLAIAECSSLKIYPKDSLVMAMYGATIGKLGILGIEAATNQACCVLTASSKIDTKYMFYILLGFRKQIVSMGYGGGQPNISQEIIKLLRIPTAPALPEQKLIADYLDHKISMIDKSVEVINEEIADLEAYRQSVISETVTKGLNPNAPMKDSGVKWIGEIPKHWNVRKLKYLLAEKLQYGANDQGEPYNNTKPRYIRISDFGYNGKLDDKNKLSLSQDKASKYLLKNGDILLARTGATVGKSFYFDTDCTSDDKYCFAGYLIKATSNPSIIKSRFLYLYTTSGAYNSWKSSIFIKSTIENISAEKYADLLVVVPPLPEQQLIANYLDRKTAKIATAIKELEFQRDDLKIYKQSLISEAVTGKIDVRDWQPNTHLNHKP